MGFPPPGLRDALDGKMFGGCEAKRGESTGHFVLVLTLTRPHVT